MMNIRELLPLEIMQIDGVGLTSFFNTCSAIGTVIG